MNKTKLMRGVVAAVCCVLVLLIAFTSTLFLYKDAVNSYLGVTASSGVADAGEDTIYYESEFGAFNDENLQKLIDATYEQTTQEMEEGAVLLKNEGGALPLAQDERSITIFGSSSVNPVIRCHSAGNTAEGEHLISMGEAFEEAGFEINQTLWEAYGGETQEQEQNLTREISEAPASFYTSAIKSSWANEYNDVAFIFLSRESGEGNDFSMQDSEGISQLALHANERALVEMVTSDPAFDKVIAILNVPTSMEVGWLDEYGVDACLWIGAPGQSGFTGMVNILTGEVNPSGHLVDVYATNSLSAPAVQNSGTNTLSWSNVSEVTAGISSESNAARFSFYTPQVEGIYVGYKYYETRYEDAILGRGNANSAAGSSDGGAWNYADEMSYTFGHGLSYTTFEQTIDSVQYNEEKDAYEVTVTVKNTGEVAGKSVVQIYAQTPYGDYERANLVEKSAVQLVAFDKTGLLAPAGEEGDEETLIIDVDRYFLASYDYTNAKTYILSAGDYYLAIGDDAHDALNNILAAKGATGMTDAAGNPVVGDADKTYTWNQEALDSETYSKSVTGYDVTNQFDDCDLNYWVEDSITYLTRQDWTTYPEHLTGVAAPAGLIEQLDGETYTKPADAPAISSFEIGVDKGIKLIDLQGKPYNDPMWEDYLDQMTVEELTGQLVDGFTTAAVASVGKPENVWGDGMDSIGGNYVYGDERPTANYTSTVTLACTWNKDLYTRRGELMGEEGMWSGGNFKNHSVGGDLHRTPFGGRNFEYVSEDSYMCAIAAANIVAGMQSHGTNASMKHMTNNDQERNRTGVSTFFNEQSFREVSLRIYEIAVTESDLHSLMTGLNRLGGTYCTQDGAMLTTVLRDEWGFEGATSSDADSATYVNVAECLAAGLDSFCYDFSGTSTRKAAQLINGGDGYILQCVRDAVKRNHFLVVNSGAMNGVGREVAETGITWWEVTIVVIDVVVALGLACALFFLLDAKYGIIDKIKGRKGAAGSGDQGTGGVQ